MFGSKLRPMLGWKLRVCCGIFLVEFVEQWLGVALLAENICLEPPWQVLLELVVHVRACRDGKNIIKFFEGALLGLGHPEEATRGKQIAL